MQPTRAASAEIPTSSFADIAFLLIIYFMLTITFASGQGLDFELPADDPSAQVVDPVESVLVEVLADSSLLVDQRPMTREGLLGYLAPKLRANPKKPVILKPRGDAPYGAMVGVFDLLRGAKDRLELDREVAIALPTERETAEFWL
jgi:biopolymer transport protein ExbD